MEIQQIKDRVLSLDFFRGLTMFLLVAESTELYSIMDWEQMHHHPWHGFRFWDLIQPFFMFIVGVAMPLSLARRQKNGQTYAQNFKHILTRSLALLVLGLGLQCAYSRQLVWELWGVLCQLSVTILIAYAIINLRVVWQLAISLILLLLTHLAYNFACPSSFSNSPAEIYEMGKNFGSWMDWVLMGKINEGGWVAINCIPTAAHTIWGVIVGKMMMDKQLVHHTKLIRLIVAGILCLIIGYVLDLADISPIIKRISTPSFVLFSGGWTLLVLAFSYWLIDIKKQVTIVFPFAVMGMNSILIYVLTQTVGPQWFNQFVGIFSGGFLELMGISAHIQAVTTAICVLFFEWLLCYYLYKKQIFLKV